MSVVHNCQCYSPLSHGGHIVPRDQKSFVLPRQVLTARLGVVKQSFFGLPGQYGRRVTRANLKSLFNKLSATFKILVIFSDGNAQNENGDIMDSSILKQTAGSLQYNLDKIFGVLIPNTEKASRIQELEGIVSHPVEVIDATFKSIADLLAFRVKRMVGCLGKNFTRNFFFYRLYIVDR